MPITPYHAKLYAYELSKRSASDSVEKLATALSEAQVDLNPHQIEAALFAFRSPLSRGAILADEVGLGKTIEAGILLAQRWAERHRQLLVICPANLRKQWSQELADKFFLPTAILETRSFNEAVRNGNLNPFDQSKIVICSFQFARSKEPYLRQTAWELVVIDEAHRLRNVYKPGNKIAKAIKGALAERQKVLLTATPLQNSLLELYGLVSIIDEFTFGDLRSFRTRYLVSSNHRKKAASSVAALASLPQKNYVRRLYANDRRVMSVIDLLTSKEASSLVGQFGRPESLDQMDWQKIRLRGATHNEGADDFTELKARLRPICQRTLRKQVLQYVNYTQRHALVQEFVPSAEEQRLYDMVSEYLQQETLYALPSSQRQLMTLMLRKLLASSTYAISNTLAGLAAKLEFAESQSTALDAVKIDAEFAENFELLPELEEEWIDDDEDSEDPEQKIKKAVALTEQQREERKQERVKLLEFHALAQSIQRNSKGEQLLTALKRGFARAEEAGKIQQKAIIFTESRRTQEYLLRLLEQTEFAGKMVLFNGTNTDAGSQRIYREWMEKHKGTDHISGSATADKRAALVEYFRDEASIMIATEAAAEGINLQFCNLVVNYDLPWNPQRIEQRIGRCHRYGQKFDVVVVNFLNKANAADVRVYELLAEKFKLFDGVFGASDEVLGAIESGIDFEKRIVGIYQQCRTAEQISFEFNQLQQELAVEIGEANSQAHEQLLNNFDQDVIDRVRVDSAGALDRFREMLWRITEFYLSPYAEFSAQGKSFMLRRNPFPEEEILLGAYEMKREPEEANTYRIGSPLAQRVLTECCAVETPMAEVVFPLTANPTKIAALDELVGRGGWLMCSLLTLESAEPQDHVIFAGVGDGGMRLNAQQCKRLFDVQDGKPQMSGQPLLTMQSQQESAELEALLGVERDAVLQAVDASSAGWLDAESSKLDRWAEDRKLALESELKELDDAIRDTRRQSLAAALLPEKLAMQQTLRGLESERMKKRRELFESQDKVEVERDTLIAGMQQRLVQRTSMKPLFTIRWRVV